jgi:hypothetical protein
MAFGRDDKRLRFIPLEEATTPPHGLINHYRDRWWAVCPERGLIFYGDTMSPQCNAIEDVARRVFGNIYPWAEIRFVPSAFQRIDPRDFC